MVGVTAIPIALCAGALLFAAAVVLTALDSERRERRIVDASHEGDES